MIDWLDQHWFQLGVLVLLCLILSAMRELIYRAWDAVRELKSMEQRLHEIERATEHLRSIDAILEAEQRERFSKEADRLRAAGWQGP
jgi:Na+-transporting methylmalonyl-CoA/oxaloacetate decarboxylase gamma subunit